MQESFFRWQERVLGILLAWGATNVVVGAGASQARGIASRQVAWQALAWGAIDLLIAIVGRRSARRKASDATPASTREAVVGFQRVLAINAVLDIGYIVGGTSFAATAGRDRRRLGVGIGIVLQGIFLALYDTVLLARTSAWNTQLPNTATE